MISEKDLEISFPKKSCLSLKQKPLRFGEGGEDSDITSIAYDPEGKFIAVGALDGSVKLHSPASGKLN